MYGTVVVMAVLIVALDDGVEGFGEAVGIVVGPLVADVAGHEAQYLLVGSCPLATPVFGAVSGLYTADEAVDGLLRLGLAFLVALGRLGGYRSSRSRWVAALVALVTGLGLFVLLLRLVLEH